MWSRPAACSLAGQQRGGVVAAGRRAQDREGAGGESAARVVDAESPVGTTGSAATSNAPIWAARGWPAGVSDRRSEPARARGWRELEEGGGGGQVGHRIGSPGVEADGERHLAGQVRPARLGRRLGAEAAHHVAEPAGQVQGGQHVEGAAQLGGRDGVGVALGEVEEESQRPAERDELVGLGGEAGGGVLGRNGNLSCSASPCGAMVSRAGRGDDDATDRFDGPERDRGDLHDGAGVGGGDPVGGIKRHAHMAEGLPAPSAMNTRSPGWRGWVSQSTATPSTAWSNVVRPMLIPAAA